MTKVCPKCSLEQDTSGFNKANRRDGLRSWCKTCESEYQKKKTENLRSLVYHKLGDTCRRCGFADKRALQIDHVNGGGNREHQEIKNNLSFLNKVLKDEDSEYQILCANCNWIKRSERAENPKNNEISPEGKQRIAEANRRPLSEEARKNLSESHMGQTPWNKDKSGMSWGNTWTDEQKANHSVVLKIAFQSRTPEERSEWAKKREANKRAKREAVASSAWPSIN